MPSTVKPLVTHPNLQRNALDLTLRDYEGTMSTLCAGCGHDSITAALTRALWELATPPHMVAKMSGIGCSSKTPAYFVGGAHGFNSSHGRMAALATGANAANRDLVYIGVSGDGDSLSIGLGQLCHAMRRNVHMVYIIENNGVYGLTKGQFSASADIGSKSKRGEPNRLAPIDPVMLGLSIGATFIARGFSGDKAQLVPLLKAAIAHRGFALLDVISPCVTFNDHAGSTKSYAYTRGHELKVTQADFIPGTPGDVEPSAPGDVEPSAPGDVEPSAPGAFGSNGQADFVPRRREIVAAIPAGGAASVMMHDGSMVRFRAVPDGYDPTDRGAVLSYLHEREGDGEIVTGLLYLDESVGDLHEVNKTSTTPLARLPYEKLCPGAAELARFQERFR